MKIGKLANAVWRAVNRCRYHWQIARNKPVSFKYNSHTYMVNPDRAAIYHIEHSTAKLDRMCSLIDVEPEVVLDVGGNCGIFSAMASRRFPASRVFCFEPSTQLLPIIAANCCNSNVTISRYAIGEADSEQTLHINPDSQQTNSLNEAAVTVFTSASRIRKVLVPCRSLDSVAREFGIRQAQVLKIDVQGYEGAVIRGAGSLLPGVDYLFIESTWMDIESIVQLIPFSLAQGFKYVSVINAVHMGADLLLSRRPVTNTDAVELTFQLDKELLRNRWGHSASQ